MHKILDGDGFEVIWGDLDLLTWPSFISLFNRLKVVLVTIGVVTAWWAFDFAVWTALVAYPGGGLRNPLSDISFSFHFLKSLFVNRTVLED